MTVAGVAWAQHRGIDAVEVSVDGGPGTTRSWRRGRRSTPGGSGTGPGSDARAAHAAGPGHRQDRLHTDLTPPARTERRDRLSHRAGQGGLTGRHATDKADVASGHAEVRARDGSDTARYRAFAAEARGRSPQYGTSPGTAGRDQQVLAFLATLPPAKRQPNLLFAAARYLLGEPADLTALHTLLTGRRDELAGIMFQRHPDQRASQVRHAAARPGASSRAAGADRGRCERRAHPPRGPVLLRLRRPSGRRNRPAGAGADLRAARPGSASRPGS